MPLYTKQDITIPGVPPANNPQYIIVPITPARALDTGRANNIPDTHPNTATTSGGWVWIQPEYEYATELLAAYKNGTFTGGPEEVAGRGVTLRMFGTPQLIASSAGATGATGGGSPPASGGASTPPAPTHSGTGATTNSSGGSDSAKLTAYIEAELQAEVRAQFPELEVVSDSNTMKGLRVLSIGLSRAIKKYLTDDVKTAYLGLETAPVALTGGDSDITPNPHSHPINPHRHDIVAP